MLGFVEGKLDSNTLQIYEYVDNLFQQVSCYRLKQVDRDGSYTYSNIVSLQPTANRIEVVVYPNPTYNYIRLLGVDESLPLSYRIFDSHGNKIAKQPQYVMSRNGIAVNLLSTGVYTIAIIEGNRRVVKKFLKN